MAVRLYVGNLPKEAIERQALEAVFAEAGELVSTKVIKDRKTGKCRGFAFVTVPSDEAADEFIDKYNGQSFMEAELKIEKALPRDKGKGKEETAEPEAAEVGTATATAKVASHKKSSKKRTRPQTSRPQADSFQPDPRWADQLAQLKEMLTTSSN